MPYGGSPKITCHGTKFSSYGNLVCKVYAQLIITIGFFVLVVTCMLSVTLHGWSNSYSKCNWYVYLTRYCSILNHFYQDLIIYPVIYKYVKCMCHLLKVLWESDVLMLCFKFHWFWLSNIPVVGAKMSVSFTTYILQIMYMNWAWIMWPLKTSLLPLVYRCWTSSWNLGWKT